MHSKARRRRLDMARHHQTTQAAARVEALVSATAAAKRAKKGKAGVEREMRRRGYVLTAGQWVRLSSDDRAATA